MFQKVGDTCFLILMLLMTPLVTISREVNRAKLSKNRENSI